MLLTLGLFRASRPWPTTHHYALSNLNDGLNSTFTPPRVPNTTVSYDWQTLAFHGSCFRMVVWRAPCSQTKAMKPFQFGTWFAHASLYGRDRPLTPVFSMSFLVVPLQSPFEIGLMPLICWHINSSNPQASSVINPKYMSFQSCKILL